MNGTPARGTNSPVPPFISARRVPSCPFCGETGPVYLAQQPDRIHGTPGRYNVRRCAQCRSLWLDPCPLPEAVSQLYSSAYYTHAPPRDLLADGSTYFERLRGEMRNAFLNSAYNYALAHRSSYARLLGATLARLPGHKRVLGDPVFYLPSRPEARLLDIGCGNGEFLLKMMRLGWQVEGIEPDAAAAAQATACGLRVHVQAVETMDFPPGSFDAVTMNHVIEHLWDVRDALRRIAMALCPGGVFVSVSPNPEGALARRLGTQWPELDVPRHLAIPSTKALAQLATEPGLDAMTWTRAGGAGFRVAYDYFLSKQSLSAEAQRRRAWYLGLYTQLSSLVRGDGEEAVLMARKPG